MSAIQIVPVHRIIVVKWDFAYRSTRGATVTRIARTTVTRCPDAILVSMTWFSLRSHFYSCRGQHLRRVCRQGVLQSHPRRKYGIIDWPGIHFCGWSNDRCSALLSRKSFESDVIFDFISARLYWDVVNNFANCPWHCHKCQKFIW